MNFKVFSVDTINVFPASNSHAGGQLNTEYNLRSDSFVASNESIQYLSGLSYAHSKSDFYVWGPTVPSFFPDDTTPLSNSELGINSGWAMVNGYFIQSLAPVILDMAAINQRLQDEYDQSLPEKLAVGLRIMFSTEATTAGSILIENNQNIFEGVQVVILPADELKTPEDVPGADQEALVTAHLRLATFNYINGAVTNIQNCYPEKCQAYPASRIKNIESVVSETFVSKKGLQAKKIYTLAGKGTSGQKAQPDTWCDSTDSLMVWDTNPTLINAAQLAEYQAKLGEFVPTKSTLSGTLEEATFGILNGTDTVLMLPHKQVDYNITNQSDQPELYAPKAYALPNADYYKGTPGAVTPTYTAAVKDIDRRLRNIYQLASGKQIYYIDELNDKKELPQISKDWAAGDYVLVGRDNTVVSTSTSEMITSPSTIYVILPGYVASIEPTGAPISTTDPYVPEGAGVMLQLVEQLNLNSIADAALTAGNYQVESHYNQVFSGTSTGPFAERGVPDVDYYIYRATIKSDSTPGNETGYIIKYRVKTTANKAYSEPLFLTGTIPLATTEMVGGFINTDPTVNTDQGYIYLDDTGHLRLTDYALLRSGVLAYQLGEDFTMPSSLDITEIQEYLDNYINDRIAFPNSNQFKNSQLPYVINVNITLPDAETATTLKISGIDSRFNTAVYFHFTGTGKNVTVAITNCEKIRLDTTGMAKITDSSAVPPKFGIGQCCLYYDASELERLDSIIGLSLWYQKYKDADPDIEVNDMTVRQIPSMFSAATAIDIWDADGLPNDNHFQVKVDSITFDTSGMIDGCSIMIANLMTSNLNTGKYIISREFTLPQADNLKYPPSCLKKQLKVTGEFVAAYNVTGTNNFILNDTKFTLMSQANTEDNTTIPGSIAIYVDADTVACVTAVTEHDGVKYIDGWEPNSYHLFSGGVVS